jgi:hypothetical protein
VVNRGRGARSTVDQRRREPKAPERSSAITGVWPLATPVHESSSAGAQQRDGSTGSLAQASPGLGRRCGDRAMVGETAEVEELSDSGARATGEGKECSGEVR